LTYVTQAERAACREAIKHAPEQVSDTLLDEIERLRAWAAVETDAEKELLMVLKSVQQALIDLGLWDKLDSGLLARVKRACEA
jgi:hypothetical protein